MDENIWNSKELKYSEDLKYEDFVTERDDATVVKANDPINKGSQPGWSFKNMVTKDIGSDIYVANITFPSGGGHNYHAHSGVEIIYMLKGKLQSTFASNDGEDVKNILELGDTIFVPHGVPHSVWNAGSGRCEFLVIKEPGYFLEDIPLPEGLGDKDFKP